jgi:hypothetical protein
MNPFKLKNLIKMATILYPTLNISTNNDLDLKISFTDFFHSKTSSPTMTLPSHTHHTKTSSAHHTIERLLEKTMFLLHKITSENLISKQRTEHSLWRGRINKCALNLEGLTKEWNNQEAIPLEWRDIEFEGETFLERVMWLWKSTREFYEHLSFYARCVFPLLVCCWVRARERGVCETSADEVL